MAEMPPQLAALYEFDTVMRKRLDAVMRGWARDRRDELARVLYEAQGYEGWDDVALLTTSAITRQRRIAAYRTADAMLVWLTGDEEAADV